jgi:hypothetical protein
MLLCGLVRTEHGRFRIAELERFQQDEIRSRWREIDTALWLCTRRKQRHHEEQQKQRQNG